MQVTTLFQLGWTHYTTYHWRNIMMFSVFVRLCDAPESAAGTLSAEIMNERKETGSPDNWKDARLG